MLTKSITWSRGGHKFSFSPLLIRWAVIFISAYLCIEFSPPRVTVGQQYMVTEQRSSKQKKLETFTAFDFEKTTSTLDFSQNKER